MKRRHIPILIDHLAGDLRAGRLMTAILSERMTEVVGGTDAEGAWSWRQAYDLVQAAAIRADREAAGDGPGDENPAARLAALEAAAWSRPTETRRSERQVRLQQFSTPLPYAYVAATAAAVWPGDVVLEPSAGTGALAHFARAVGGRPVLNEIDPFRAAILHELFGASPTRHDAEHIDDLLDRCQEPDVVLMNPPFASSATRGDDPTIALRHVLSAAKRLAPGGRLVAILPTAACARRQPVLWARLMGLVAPRLHLALPGRVFAKMGTSVDTALLVADRREEDVAVGATTEEARPVVSLAEALEVVTSELPERPTRAERPVGGSAKLAPVRQGASGTASSVLSAAKRRRIAPMTTRTPSSAPVAYTVRDTPAENVALSEVYARYAPQRIEIAGAVEHPSPLVESVAMAAVAPPVPTGTPLLPSRLASEGALSAAQLETIVMADAAHGADLPGRFTVSDDWTEIEPAVEGAESIIYRLGYFLGDGTGAGKGRQVAGVILAGWLAGRTRAVWISKSKTLIEDAVRDWSDLGGAPTDIVPLDRWKPDEEITLQRGILFLTYATLRSVGKTGRSRLEQLVEWCGPEFEGVLAFDEAHAMQNAAGSGDGAGGDAGGSMRGGAAPSQQGIAGLRLQTALPRARVLYVSATGATNVGNLAYATRLGLWGPGDAYPFPTREDFVAAMTAGGVAAMEVVARDLKALGLYTARALSFEGVEYDILEHRLTEDERAAYDRFASAFKVIHQNLHAALEATGITDGESGVTAGAAKASALSRFESMKQRFFGHVLNGFKASTLIRAIEDDLAEGWAPVVQIVSTGESHLGRAIEGADGDDLTEAHLTPKEAVVHWLREAFPVQAHRIVEVDGVMVAEKLYDGQGRPVVSREAEALREAALMELYTVAPIPSVLDRLVWHFGEERLAEVTGRSKRTVKISGGSLKVVSRSASANSAETAAFMAGTKPVLLFSDAGGTGRSYHAALGAANQARRRHYLVEPGWRAAEAIQGLGRTHRSAQTSAPWFRVVTTDVHGEKRFTSTIARRLDTLGALTRGQRETGSQNLFRASDNLESPHARRALVAHYRDLATNRCDAMPYERFLAWTALKLTDGEGVILDELPPIQRYLNRLLALPIDMQNALFAAFSEKIESQVERARAAGTLDLGIETLRADRITVVGEEDLWTCPKSGSVTRTVTLETERAVHVLSAEGALSDWGDRMRPMRNAASGKVALVSAKPYQVFEDDVFAEMRDLRRPAGRSSVTEDEFERSHWEPMEPGAFVRLWDAEADALPRVATERLVLLTGLLLPIWKDIPSDSERIWRVTPEGTPSMIGRAISPEQAVVLRGKLKGGDAASAEEMVAAAMAGDGAVDLRRGLTLRVRRVAGARRLELDGWRPEQVPQLTSAGCFTEIIAHQLRVFVPVGERAGEVIEAVREGRGAAAPAIAA